MRRVIDEMDAPRVVEGAGVALEPVREPPEERRAGRRALARGRPAVLGHEMVGTLALADVVTDRRGLLDALAEVASHEEREVADVLGDRHLVLGLEVRAVPGGAGLEQQVHDRLEPGNRRPARVQVLGPREERQQIGEIRRGRVVADGQVVEARSDRTIEKRAKLHTGNHSKFSHSRRGAGSHSITSSASMSRGNTRSRRTIAAGCASKATGPRRTLSPSTTAGPIHRMGHLDWGWLARV